MTREKYDRMIDRCVHLAACDRAEGEWFERWLTVALYLTLRRDGNRVSVKRFDGYLFVGVSR